MTFFIGLFFALLCLIMLRGMIGWGGIFALAATLVGGSLALVAVSFLAHQSH
jgi:hypothetical protein